MKINLDFDEKEVTVENGTNLKLLIDKLQVVLKDYEEWSISVNNNHHFVEYVEPIVIDKTPYRPYPWWESQPTVCYDIHNNPVNHKKNDYKNIVGIYTLNIKD
jgi:hypothetical protein